MVPWGEFKATSVGVLVWKRKMFKVFSLSRLYVYRHMHSSLNLHRLASQIDEESRGKKACRALRADSVYAFTVPLEGLDFEAHPLADLGANEAADAVCLPPG